MTAHPLTLLIVESSVIADRIRKIAPPFLTVYATKGYLWHPIFDEKILQLRKKADPNKVSLRKELKEQAQWASKIVIATDSDPSGDFIACTLAQHLRRCTPLRTNLNSISRASIEKSVNSAVPFEPKRVLKALEAKYLIRNYWKRYYPDLTLLEAGLIVLFGTDQFHKTFESENGLLFESSVPIQLSLEKEIAVEPVPDKKGWEDNLPSSTFDIVPLVQKSLQRKSYSEAQEILNRLFVQLDPESGDGLITYPRSAENRFYSDSWQRMQEQWVYFENLDRFRNTTLRDTLHSEAPHEAIHPTDLRHHPDRISKSIPKELANVYELIYRKTMSAITIPETEKTTFSSQKYPKVTFISKEEQPIKSVNLRPVFTVSEIGALLENMGVLKASGFGSFLDRALESNLIFIQDNGVASPGKAILSSLSMAAGLKSQLLQLRRFSTDSDHSVETLQKIFSS